VQLYVYDLTQGLAKQFSMALLGKQIDGVWHTGVVVFGIEYFYGGGIQRGIPGKTVAGTPVQIHDLGTTMASQQEFEHFSLRDKPSLYARNLLVTQTQLQHLQQ